MPSANSLPPEMLLWGTYRRKEHKGELPGSIAETLRKTYPMRASFQISMKPSASWQQFRLFAHNW